MKPTDSPATANAPPRQATIPVAAAGARPGVEADGPAGLLVGQGTLIARVDSTSEDVRDVLKRVSEELQRLGIASTDMEAIEVVLAECMNNVVEHAYGEAPDGQFEIRLFLNGENLFCRLEDDGRPMPGLAIPAGTPADLDVDLQDLPEGGFGWFLIRELTQDLSYKREDDRNSLSFHIQLGQSA